MSELVQRFRSQLGRREYAALEDTWLELLAAATELAELLNLADLAERWAPKETTSALLSVLASHLKDQGQLELALSVLRRLAKLTPDDAALAREIAGCVRLLYQATPLIERILQKSGLGYGQPLLPSLEQLDRYLGLLPGKVVYDQERGPGRVTNLDLLLDRVTVTFADSSELTLATLTASRRLRATAADGFFALLVQDRPRLSRLAATEPGRVVTLFLRDIQRHASVADIQQGLAELIPPDEWASFWEKARKELAQEPHVQVITSPVRSYRWVAQPVATEKTAAAPGQRRPRRQWDGATLGRLSIPELTQTFSTLATTTDRRHFLEQLSQVRTDDWDRVYAALFPLAQDSRCRTLIEQALAQKRPELWRSVLETVLTNYRQQPEAFIWLVAQAERLTITSTAGLLSRMLELLESVTHRSRWNRLRRLLSAKDYQLVRLALKELDQEEADRLLDRVAKAPGLEAFRKDEIGQLVTGLFPALARTEEATVIYSTALGIEKARAELRQLTEKDLPAAAEEIARARAHGDLSENYEFKAAKEKQARLLARITRLRQELAHAQPIALDQIDTSVVTIGCRVSLTDPEGHSHHFLILGPWDADHEKGIISYQSPLAKQLLGKTVGQSVKMAGQVLTIQEITADRPH